VVCVFVACLGYFVFVTGWYEPARLVVKGRAVDTDTVVNVQWDSGAGYNAYEKQQFQFLATRGDNEKEHLVVLNKTLYKNPLSKGSRVVLYEIRNDDRGLPIPKKALNAVRKNAGSGWFLESSDSEIRLSVAAKDRLHFMFKSDDRSGMIRVSIDGQVTQHDLYRSNWAVLFSKLDFWLLDENGNFTVSFDMPRYKIESVRISAPYDSVISSLFLQTKSKLIELPITRTGDGYVLSDNPTRSLKRFFHPSLILFQLIFAALIAWLFMIVGQKFFSYGNFKNVFIRDERWLFWFFLSGTISIYSMWLLAFWPGVMSVDSLNIWRAALLPDVMVTNHPILNEIWYMFFQQLLDNIVIIPITQIVLLSILIASTFFHIFRQGVKIRLLLPCYLLLVLSLPVGLYSVTLWKDVPFALLVVFWSLTPAYFFYRKKKNRPIILSLGQIVMLLLMFFALLFFRHNGMVYLFVLPIIFVAVKLVRVPKTLVLISCILATGLLLLVIFPPKAIKTDSYFLDLSRNYLQQIKQESSAKRITRAIAQYPRLLDINKNQKNSDFWHYYLGDRYAYTFLRDVGWNDSYKYLPPDKYLFPALHDYGLFLYKKSLEYPWVYLTWYPFPLLYLFPLSILFCRRFPLSAIFSTVILAQVFALLVFVGTTNWRYYYFVLLGGYFVLPIVLLDWHCRVSPKQMVGK